MEYESSQGGIHVIYGPMFAGKSSELMKRVRRLTYAKKKCLVVNYTFDNRYGESVVASHDKITIKAYKCQKLSEIKNIYGEFDIIAVDEGQFFPDIVEMCDEIANAGKLVIVSALDATFDRKPFGNIVNLLPIAETVTKLRAICLYCSGLASFTRRKISSKEIQIIGADDIYEPVCRKCYFNQNYKEIATDTTSDKSEKSEKSYSSEKIDKNDKLSDISNESDKKE